jgi:hypothetical protein
LVAIVRDDYHSKKNDNGENSENDADPPTG